MKISLTVFFGALLVGVSSYIVSHEDIETLADLFLNIQHLGGLLGAIGSVIMAYFATPPAGGVSRLTGSGATKTPNVVDFKK